MKLVFSLSKENISLAKSEVLRLLKPRYFLLVDNYLFVTVNKISDDYYRLAYAKKAYLLLFSARQEWLKERIDCFEWGNHYSGSYRLGLSNFKDSRNLKRGEKNEVTDALFYSIRSKIKRKPNVNLSNPKTKFEFVILNNRVYALRELWKNKQDFSSRKAHNRPFLHPTSLHPKLARACINLSGKKSGTILDPFCGSGGILIEAGLLGFKVVGNDLEKKMLSGAEKNLKYFKIRDFKLVNKDALKLGQKASAIITDVPYGKGSKLKQDLQGLVKDFLKSSYSKASVIVLMLPDFVDIKKAKGKWRIVGKFEHYLHKSLTKKIYLLEK